MNISKKMQDAFNAQITAELYSSNLYLEMAFWNQGIMGTVPLITFSNSQHHSRVDVQLTSQFSADFQRGLALTVIK